MAVANLSWQKFVEGVVTFTRSFTYVAGFKPATIFTLGSYRCLPAAVFLKNVLDAMYGTDQDVCVRNLDVNEQGAVDWPEGDIIVPVLLLAIDCEYVSVSDLEVARKALLDFVVPKRHVHEDKYVQVGVLFPSMIQARSELEGESFVHVGPSRPEQVEFLYPWENVS